MLQRKKGGECTITTEWILEKLRKGVCEASYPPLKLVFDTPRHPLSPSLDRIDSSNPSYTPENTRLVANQINMARSNFDDASSADILYRAAMFMYKEKVTNPT
jgi:hypothetical protein